jgi:hypothetical protein
MRKEYLIEIINTPVPNSVHLGRKFRVYSGKKDNSDRWYFIKRVDGATHVQKHYCRIIEIYHSVSKKIRRIRQIRKL